MDRKAIAIIPARYGSTRFPAKVIANLKGKPIIQWVYEKAKLSIADEVYIATDNELVFNTVTEFGGEAIMTSTDHPSGTDRIREAVTNLEGDIIINVQGDEPLIPVSVINELIETMKQDPEIEMGTVAVPCERSDVENNPNIVKVVFDTNNYARYFSRAMIPFLREGGDPTPVYRHWGIYGYRRDILEKYVSLDEGVLEKCEKLEQLRALENGISIKVILSDLESIGIDTPEDLILAEAKFDQLNR